MKLRTACLAGMVIIAPSLTRAQNPSASAGARGLVDTSTVAMMDAPKVHAGLFTLNAEGRIGAAAMQSGDRQGADLAGIVYLAPCNTVGAANPGHAISASATEVWKLTGSVVEVASDRATVQLSWQRVRKGGKDEEPTPQWVTVTLKRDERTTLEAISIPAAGNCPARDASLEIAFISMKQLFAANAAAGQTPGSLGPRPSVSGTISKHFSEFGFLGDGNVSMPTALRAELWLVRSSPGSDEVRHLRSPVGSIPMSFGFAPISIQTSAGTLTVKVEGTVESGATATGSPQFHFSAKRTTMFAPANRAARDTTPVVEVSTKTTVAMPGPDDVLSFELPPLQTPDGRHVADRLSVRVKLTPEPTRPAHPR
jgi:hypothetical protein